MCTIAIKFEKKSPFKSNLTLQIKIDWLRCYASRWLKEAVKMYLSLNHSFKRFIQKPDSSSNETSKRWESHWIIQNHMWFCLTVCFFLLNHERTTISIKKQQHKNKQTKKKLNLSRIMQLYFCTWTALKQVQFLCSLLNFVLGIQQQLYVLQEETHNNCDPGPQNQS